MPTILVAGSPPPPWYVEEASREGIDVCTTVTLDSHTADVVAYVMNSFDGVEPPRADRHLLRRLPDLKVVVYQGQSLEPRDYDGYADFEDLQQLGIPLVTTPAGDPVAESAFALLIALDLNLVSLATAAEVDPVQRRGLRGRTLGIVGLGQIGRRMAQMAHAAEMNIAYTSRRRNHDVERQIGATPLSLESLLSRCDFVSIHLPLSAPAGFIDRDALRGAEGLGLVNTTSAPRLVDPEALHAALVDGRVHRAAVEGTYAQSWQEQLLGLGLHRYISLPAYASWDTAHARDSSWRQSLHAVRAVMTERAVEHRLA